MPARSEVNSPSVDLQASASAQIANDQMVVRLSAEQSGTDMGAMNEKVLSSLQAAIEKSKQVPGVSARLGSITTQAEWGPQGERTGWRVQGSLVLEGSDMAATGSLAGRLGAELSIDGVEFRLTPARRIIEENRLLRDAADAFRERATRTATAFGYAGYELKKIVIRTRGSIDRPPMPMMARTADASPSEVPTEGGMASVEVGIDGSIVLK